ncbi:MAG: hypothetical protein ABSB59_17020 [Streptosporangiaceae bacterium]
METHVRRLALGCAGAGDEVTVITHQFGDAPPEERAGRVRVLRFPPWLGSLSVALSGTTLSAAGCAWFRGHPGGAARKTRNTATREMSHPDHD